MLRGPVLYIGGSCFAGAVGTTEELARNFHSMSNHLALAMLTDRRHRLNCTLEAVEDVAIARRDKLETFVVIISTDFALCHVASPIGQSTFGGDDFTPVPAFGGNAFYKNLIAHNSVAWWRRFRWGPTPTPYLRADMTSDSSSFNVGWGAILQSAALVKSETSRTKTVASDSSNLPPMHWICLNDKMYMDSKGCICRL